MADDKKEIPKPKDLSKVKTADLIREFATLKEAQVTALQKEAVKQLKFPAVDEGELKEAEKARVALRIKELRKTLQDKGEAALRPELEKQYRAMEAISNAPEQFQKAVDTLKKRFQGGGEEKPMADDTKKIPKPKDLSKTKTEDLIKEFAEMSAKVDIDVAVEIARLKKYKPFTPAELKAATAKKVKTTMERETKKLADSIEDFGKEDGAKAYRAALEEQYRKVEEVKNNPEALKERVEALMPPPVKDVMGLALMAGDISREVAALVSAQQLALSQPLVDKLSIPAKQRSTTTGHGA